MFEMEFRSVDPRENRYRYYRVVEGRTLFGQPCLHFTWGRIGESACHRTEHFEDVSLLECRQREVLAERRRNGYVVFSTHEGDPSMSTTPSETARLVRAELEAIIAGLGNNELARLLELGRKLADAPPVHPDSKRAA